MSRVGIMAVWFGPLVAGTLAYLKYAHTDGALSAANRTGLLYVFATVGLVLLAVGTRSGKHRITRWADLLALLCGCWGALYLAVPTIAADAHAASTYLLGLAVVGVVVGGGVASLVWEFHRASTSSRVASTTVLSPEGDQPVASDSTVATALVQGDSTSLGSRNSSLSALCSDTAPAISMTQSSTTGEHFCASRRCCLQR